MNYNTIIILGRVTATPELRSTPSGQPVAHVRVAVNRTWTNKQGEKKEEVEFHHVVIFGKMADVASNFLQKGSLVLFEGRPGTRTWTDKNGEKPRRVKSFVKRCNSGRGRPAATQMGLAF